MRGFFDRQAIEERKMSEALKKMEASREWTLYKDHEKREIAFNAGIDAAEEVAGEVCCCKPLIRGLKEA